jgi:hypothetical protein
MIPKLVLTSHCCQAAQPIVRHRPPLQHPPTKACCCYCSQISYRHCRAESPHYPAIYFGCSFLMAGCVLPVQHAATVSGSAMGSAGAPLADGFLSLWVMISPLARRSTVARFWES